VTIHVTAVNDAPVVTLSTSTVSGQYSDAISSVTVTAEDVDTKGADITFNKSGLPADLTLTANSDGTTGTPSTATPGKRTATIAGRLNVACAGTQPSGQPACTLTSPYAASISASDGSLSDAKTLSVTVTRESASITDFSPESMFVSSAGGSATPTIIMTVNEPNDGNLSRTLSAGAGLANAKPIAVNLTPVGTGSSASCSATNTQYSPAASTDTATASCSTTLNVNVYDMVANIGGDYFMGSGESVITIMDPTLGFTTGGGHFSLSDGTRVNFGFNAKILKSSQVQGSSLTIFKRATGNYIVKSNSMGGLAVAKVVSQTYYGATLNGKATYSVPTSEGVLAPFCPADYKCGGYTFTVYVEDQKEPGAGADRYWIQVKDPAGSTVAKASMSGAASTGAQTISGGNIQVPQPQAGK
jgi:hypothetical protein